MSDSGLELMITIHVIIIVMSLILLSINMSFIIIIHYVFMFDSGLELLYLSPSRHAAAQIDGGASASVSAREGFVCSGATTGFRV